MFKMILEETYQLSNGVKIPKIGLGTWFIRNKDVVSAVKEAIKLGYRHIDTAQAYRNEKGVGEAIRNCNVNRKKLFVTTKLAAEVKSYKKAITSIKKSLKTMGLDYIDMMIIHSPQPWSKFRGKKPYYKENREIWKALEEAYKAGKLKAIGLSNFEKADIDNILKSCTVKPMVNQILAHISNTPKELIQYSQEKDILVEAYSPIAHGELMKNNDVKKMAKKYGVSVPQLSIRYDLQLGLPPIPKTSNPVHMKTNVDVDFVISDEDMMFLKNVEKIKEYENANMKVLFGNKIDFKTLISMLFDNSNKKK